MRTLDGDQFLARVFFAEDDHYRGHRLVKLLPERLRGEGFAGCTIFRSAHGFGLHHRLHTDVAEVSPAHGLILEVVDDEPRIERLLAILDEVLVEGLVTVERAHVVRYRAGTADATRVPAEGDPR
jgi:PII-like signaling protein